MIVNISTPRHQFHDSNDPDGYYYTYVSDRSSSYRWYDDDQEGWLKHFEYHEAGLFIHRKQGAVISSFLDRSPEIEWRAPIHRLAMALHVMTVAYSMDCVAALAEALRFLSDPTVARGLLLEYD